MTAAIRPSKVSRIYDQLLAICKEVFPEHAELRDLEDLSNNPDQVLRAAYGIQPGSGENTERCLTTTTFYLQREFEIVLTREQLRQADDVRTMHDKAKEILEDLNMLLRKICGQCVLGTQGELSFNVKYTGDQGPRNIQVGESAYCFIEALITAEYSEKTTGGI